MMGSNGIGRLHIVVGRPCLDFSFKICKAYIKIPVSDFGRKKKDPEVPLLHLYMTTLAFGWAVDGTYGGSV